MSDRKRQSVNTRLLVLCALFVAVIAVCAWITVPIGAVPVTLQVMGVLLCAALLPPSAAVLTLTAYALLGLIGAPVFSGMSGGAARLFGVTGGYILGFIPCAWVTSALISRWGRGLGRQIAAMVLGTAVCYLFGTAWFMVLDAGNQARPLATVMALCVTPFLPFDAVKIVLAAVLSRRLYEPMRRLTRV